MDEERKEKIEAQVDELSFNMLGDSILLEPGDRVALREILTNPIYVRACNYIVRAAQPNRVAVHNWDPARRLANHDLLAGMTEFIARMDQLITEPPVVNTDGAAPHWGDELEIQ